MTRQLSFEPADEIPELPECPFCGSLNLKIKPVWKTWYFVACLDCRADGPVRKTKAEAAEAWSVRAAIFARDFGEAVHDGHLWRRS